MWVRVSYRSGLGFRFFVFGRTLFEGLGLQWVAA